MKKLIKITLLVCICLLNKACDDVFEKDISGEKVTIISPKKQDTIHGNTVQFRWNAIENVESYRVQVTEEKTEVSFLDSLVTVKDFTYTLNPGKYNWKVRGENFAYHTPYSEPIPFTVLISEDLYNQKVFLTAPTDNMYTNKNTIILTWDKIRVAKSYQLEVDKTVLGKTTTEINEDDLTENSYTLSPTTLSEDAIYTWKVKAVNSTSNTEFSTRKFFLDTNKPNKPTLGSPDNNKIETELKVAFSWNLGNDTGEVQSPLSSKLEIASDTNFTSIIKTFDTKNLSQEYTFSSNGDYYWRVTTIDDATNQSDPSEVRKLTVQK